MPPPDNTWIGGAGGAGWAPLREVITVAAHEETGYWLNVMKRLSGAQFKEAMATTIKKEKVNKPAWSCEFCRDSLATGIRRVWWCGCLGAFRSDKSSEDRHELCQARYHPYVICTLCLTRNGGFEKPGRAAGRDEWRIVQPLLDPEQDYEEEEENF